MKTSQCIICHLEIDLGDAQYGRVTVTKEGYVHTYCEEFSQGHVPECPLFPQFAHCEFVDDKPGCQTMSCQVGQSMRVLRGLEKKPAFEGTSPSPGDFYGRDFAIMQYGSGIEDSPFFRSFDGTCPECLVNRQKCPPNPRFPGLDGFMIPFGCYDCNHFNHVSLAHLRKHFAKDEVFTLDCEKCRAQIDIPESVLCRACGTFLRHDAQHLIDHANNRSSAMLYYFSV